VFDDYFTILKGGPAAPEPPDGLAVLPLTATSALLHWKDQSVGEERYEVLISDDGVLFTNAATLPPDSTGFTFYNLSPGNTYHCRIIASNVAGTAHSEPFQFQHPFDTLPVAPVQHWRFTHWGHIVSSGDCADMADYDGDGSVNLLEYALFSSPLDPLSLPEVMPSLSPDGRLVLTFPRRAAADLTYTVEFSSNPATSPWEEAFSSSGGLNTEGLVAVEDPLPDVRRFARLRVMLLPP
jgi:hypothetical protein